MKKTFKQFLIETPINSYDTVGNFSKNSSFRDKRDRFLVTNPRTIDIVRKKFNSTNTDFNFIFVNNSKARLHTEVGEVSLNWVKDNLGTDVFEKLNTLDLDDNINIIFTNNNGSERMPMTAWIIAHRIGHVLARNRKNELWHMYKNVHDFLINAVSDIATNYYKFADFPNSVDKLSVPSYRSVNDKRKYQLFMLKFFQEVCTFKSARDKNIREWFEVLNELIAQYLTTGKIKFNPPPKIVKYNKNNIARLNDDEYEELNEHLQTIARDMEYYLDDLFSSSYGKIYVM